MADTMSKRCFYDVLCVDKGADAKALKSAFRKLAMKHHPDRNGGCEEASAKFKEASEAYETLSDDQKRAIYDQYGHEGLAGAGGAGGMGGGGRPEDVFRDVFGDVFSEFFGGARGGGGRGNSPARGADLRYDYEISLEQAFAGKKADITIPGTEACDTCSGTGAAEGAEPETCDTCQGHGRVRMQQGFFTMERTCTRCQGKGQTIKDPCKTCSGRGHVRKERTLSVTIPAGIEDGQRIRLSGEGEAGDRGGPPGDLYIFVSVREHEIFERDGPHLYAQAAVPMCKAALGGDIEMPTIDGQRMRVAIPEGAQTGKRMRLRGKGMPNLRGGAQGDLYVELFVETPRNLTAEQKEVLRQFSEDCCESSHPESRSFFKRVKDFFDKDDSGDSASA